MRRGQKHTEETKEKIRKARLGRGHSEATKEKMAFKRILWHRKKRRERELKLLKLQEGKRKGDHTE